MVVYMPIMPGPGQKQVRIHANAQETASNIAYRNGIAGAETTGLRSSRNERKLTYAQFIQLVYFKEELSLLEKSKQL